MIQGPCRSHDRMRGQTEKETSGMLGLRRTKYSEPSGRKARAGLAVSPGPPNP